MRKFLPLMLIAFVALIFLPQLFGNRNKGEKTLSGKDRSALTLDAVNRIDRGQTKYLAANGRYTTHLSDLVAQDKQLAQNLTIPLTIEIDVSENGKSYLARVSSDVISYARARANGKITASSCRVVKSGSGIKCPEPAAKTTTTTTTTATTTTG